MSILAIDTSSKHFQIALFHKNQTHKYVSNIATDHARLLAKSTHELLKNNSLEVEDLTEVRIIVGPGSYTGLRIGLAYAKTLTFLNKQIKTSAISKFEFSILGLNKEKQHKNFTVILNCGKRGDEYFVQTISNDLQKQEKMMIVHKDSLTSFPNIANSSIVSDCKDLNIEQPVIVANQDISHLTDPQLKFQKRNVEIIYLREIYAKISRKNFALT